MVAHVPDLQDFLQGLQILAGPQTVISIENPSLVNLLVKDQFDSIYHEHYSYLSVHSVEKIASNFGLHLYDVESIDTHGGSNRYWLELLKEEPAQTSFVKKCIADELHLGILDPSLWLDCASRVDKIIFNFRKWSEESFQEGKRIFGYGAAAKASTLINASGILKEWMPAIIDGSHEKQGRFMPTEGIPIISPEVLYLQEPTDILIFPWNIQVELIEKITASLQSKPRLWIAIPSLQRVF